MGCALVLSDISGHRSWAMDDFAVMVPTVEAAYPIGGDLRGLSVDSGQLQEVLTSLAEDRERTRQMGLQASVMLPRMVGWDRVVRDLMLKIR